MARRISQVPTYPTRHRLAAFRRFGEGLFVECSSLQQNRRPLCLHLISTVSGKWQTGIFIRIMLEEGIHSNDMLRVVECPSDILNQGLYRVHLQSPSSPPHRIHVVFRQRLRRRCGKRTKRRRKAWRVLCQPSSRHWTRIENKCLLNYLARP